MKLFKTYITPYLKQYYRSILLAVFFGVLTVLGSAALTFTSGYLISSASLMPYNILMLYVPIVLVRTFGISQAVTRYLERLTGHNTVLKILADMRVRLYGMLEPQALFIRSRFQTGDLLGTLADDIEHLQDVYIRTIFPTMVAFLVFACSIGSIAVFDWKFALITALCLIIIVVVYPLLSLYLLKKNQAKQKEKRSHLYAYLTDAVFGLSDWIISGKKNRFITQFQAESFENSALDKKQRHWNQSRELQLRILSGLILIMVGIWAGMEAQNGVIAPAYIAAFTLVTLPIIEGLIPISQAVEKIPSYQESMKRIEKIEEFVVPDSKGHISEAQALGEILIDKVSFRYEKEPEDAIKKISFSIQDGKKIALLGKSGAGKSTLLQLLLGVQKPTEGHVSINGYAPQEYGDNIYEVMGVLNQKPYLFATTVENNIRLGKQNATKEELEKVIRQVKLDKYIHSLPKGLSTQMEEAGARFSGGERQRIALARILLKNTPIVILDEPTVGLDPLTEYDLIETIFETLQDKTVIWITHHLIGMEKMDKIFFIDKGKIAMSGNHHELLETSERYRQLYELDRGGI
jgi:ATP-binding cassette subfamily C protein CydC